MSAFGPQRIVCLSTETCEVLYALGEQQRIVGISGFTVRPPQARKEKPKIGAFTSAKHDEILALQPDLVLAGTQAIQAEVQSVTTARPVRPPRPHAPTVEELAAHEAFIKGFKSPLWLAE